MIGTRASQGLRALRTGERKGFFFSYEENGRPTRGNRHGMGKRSLPAV
jgi:hypothetical protein